jgi:hypothetical protein
MAVKTAQIIINVDDKSLVELNQEIKQLETSMQGLKTGTKEWIQANQKLGTLKGQFGQATQEAKKLQGAVQELGSAERIRAVAKLGAGMVGAFSAASGAAKLLGGNAKQWDEMTAKAATLMSIMGGLNQISELFSKQSLMGLKSIGQGFGTLVRTVRTASTGMKIALISTGIGALVVAVGLLIANFDKLKNLVSGKSREEKKAAESNLKIAEQQVKQQQVNLSYADKLLEQEKEKQKLSKKTFDVVNAERTQANEQLQLLEKQRAEQLAIVKLKDVELKKYADVDEHSKKAKQDSKKILDDERALADAATIVLDVQIKTLQLRMEELAVQKKLAVIIDENLDAHKKTEDAIRSAENEIVKLNALEFKSLEIYQQQLKIIDTNIYEAKLKLSETAAGEGREELAILANLEAQRQALVSQEILRKKQLAIDLESIKNEINRNRIVDEFNRKIYDVTIAMKYQADIEMKRQKILDNNNKLIALDLKGMEGAKKVRDEIVNFDLKRNKILKNRLVELYPSELKVTEKIFGQIKNFLQVYSKDVGYESLQFFADKVKELSDNFKTNLVLQAGLNKGYAEQSKYGKQLIDDAAQELALKQIAADFAIKALGEQLDAVKLQKSAADNLAITYGVIADNLVKQQIINKEKLETQKELLSLTTNEEQRLVILTEINKLENENAGIQQEVNSANDEQNAQLGQSAILTQQINDLDYEQKDAVASVGAAQTEISNQLEDQLRLSAKLQQFTEKYAEEIQVVGQIVGQSMELMAVRFAEKAKKAQRELDKLQKQQEELAKDDEKHQDKLTQYEEELKDANGDRYDTLLGLIAQENAAIDENKAKKDQIDLDLKAKDKERQKALHKQAVWEKTNALIQAIINTALGVIKALPNVFLAIATGVLGAVGIGVIAAQKIPPMETMATGGKAKGGLTMVGEEGFELAELPAGTRVYNHQDSMRMLAGGQGVSNAMAEGGFVPPTLGEAGKDMIDYDRLVNGIVNGIKLLPSPVVQVQKITQAQNEISVTKELAGISR